MQRPRSPEHPEGFEVGDELPQSPTSGHAAFFVGREARDDRIDALARHQALDVRQGVQFETERRFGGS